jgi:uncharacterized protein involved in tellurium resistance
MTRYTLNSTDGEFSNTLEFEAEHINEVLMYMMMFLQGSGFTWLQGELDVVDPETAGKSHHYFDTERNR